LRPITKASCCIPRFKFRENPLHQSFSRGISRIERGCVFREFLRKDWIDLPTIFFRAMGGCWADGAYYRAGRLQGYKAPGTRSDSAPEGIPTGSHKRKRRRGGEGKKLIRNTVGRTGGGTAGEDPCGFRKRLFFEGLGAHSDEGGGRKKRPSVPGVEGQARADDGGVKKSLGEGSGGGPQCFIIVGGACRRGSFCTKKKRGGGADDWRREFPAGSRKKGRVARGGGGD